MIWSRRGSIIFAVLFAGAGCQAPRGPVSIDSDDPDLKIQAMECDAKHDNRADTPKLVAALQSDDPAIRFYAIQALRRMTHDDFGYRFYDDDDQPRSRDGQVAGVVETAGQTMNPLGSEAA